MPKQIGITRYQGKIGQIRHFKVKGLDGEFAAFANTVSAERIKSASEYERTRENMNEFGGCATAGKSIRKALSPVLDQMGDRRVTGRMIPIIKRINLEDLTESRGYRAILFSTHGYLFKGFELNGNTPLNALFRGVSTVAQDEASKEVVLSVAPFVPSKLVKAPKGSTHFRLVGIATAIADFIYNASTKLYEPSDAQLNESTDIVYSDYITIGNELLEEVQLQMKIAAMAVGDHSDVSLFVYLGIECFQKVGSRYVEMNSGSAMQVVEVL